MRNQPVPLVTGFYQDEDRPFSQQDVWGYLPCKTEAPGTRSQLMLKTDPGLYPYVEAGEGTVRGIHDVEGRLFVVIGTTLYRISNTGVALPIGTIPGIGRVSMDHNQIANGNELTVVNGSAGYVHNTVTGAFGRITDSGFPGSPIIKFLDSLMLGIDPAGRFAFNSDPANAREYNTLNRWTSEYRPDRLVSMGRASGELLLLSANSGEFFQNSGSATQPFRTKQIYLDKGCAGPHTVVEADNTIFWLGSDGYFYQLDGYAARRISTRPIEQAIRGLDWWNAFGYLWESEGHTCVHWTFLNGHTWRWDTSQQEWSRRESYGWDRWRVSCTTRSNGQWYAGDLQQPRIWNIRWNYPWEGDTEFVSGFTQPVIHDNQNDLIHNRLELVMGTGGVEVAHAEFPEQPTGPTISGVAGEADPNAEFTFQYTVTAGSSPVVSVQIVGGNLPDDWTVDVTGLLEGETPAEGLLEVVLRATDANGLTYDHPDTIPIDTGIFVVSVTPTDGSVQTMQFIADVPETDAGDALLLFVSARNANNFVWPSLATPAGWTLVGDESTGNTTNLSRSFWFHKISAGGAADTVDVDVSSDYACSFAALVYRVKGSDGNPPDFMDDSNAGTSITVPTPPLLTPGWTGEDALWVAGFSGNGTLPPVTWPLPNAQGIASQSGSLTTKVCACTVVAEGFSMQPGQFVMGGPTSWAAYTLAFRKAP